VSFASSTPSSSSPVDLLRLQDSSEFAVSKAKFRRTSGGPNPELALRRRDPQRQDARWRRCVHRRSSATKPLGDQPHSSCQNLLDWVLGYAFIRHREYGLRDRRFRPKLFWDCIRIGVPNSVGHCIEIWGVGDGDKDDGGGRSAVQAVGVTCFSLFAFTTEGLQKGVMSIASNLLRAGWKMLLAIFPEFFVHLPIGSPSVALMGYAKITCLTRLLYFPRRRHRGLFHVNLALYGGLCRSQCPLLLPPLPRREVGTCCFDPALTFLLTGYG
jgi:hypothetical protein